MTLAAMRTWLQRLLKDTAGRQWSSVELDAALNVAYSLVQKEVVKKFGVEVHITWDTIPTEANTNWYPLPPTFGIVQVGVKGSAADTDWAVVPPKRYRDIGPARSRNYQPPAQKLLTNGPYYTKRGQWIGIFPAPPAVLADGIQLLHGRIMSMSGDDDVQKVKEPLAPAIVFWAHILMVGETDESAQESQRRLGEILGDLESWYEVDADEPAKFLVER
jgi:hypothetical protein